MSRRKGDFYEWRRQFAFSGPVVPYTGSFRGKATLGIVLMARSRSSLVVHSSYLPVGG